MTVPVLYTLARSNPRTRFTLLTKPGMTRVFVNPPRNLHIVGVKLPGSTFSDIRALWDAVTEAGSERPVDLFVDLHDVLRTKILRSIAILKGIPTVKFDKARRAKRQLLRQASSGKPLSAVSSTIKRYDEAFPSSLNRDKKFSGIFEGQPDGRGSTKILEHLCPAKSHGERWIGIAPFARHKGKVYPADLMHQVIDELAWSGRTRIFLFGGGKAEVEILNEWAAPYDNVVCVAGKLKGLDEELALISHLDAMLAMDSANMHLAALTGTPSISIWGATHPAAGFTPFGAAPSDMIQVDMPCRPCSVFGNKPCKHGDIQCMRSIHPSDVAAKILDKAKRK